MTDRELLELAGTAAGFNAFAGHAKQMIESGWNPLTDDGDALRLAVKLERFTDNNFWNHVFSCRNGFDFGVDEHAATRRAIVRAAAEVGAGLRPFPTVDEIRAFTGDDAEIGKELK
jgi:hypothetical protein